MSTLPQNPLPSKDSLWNPFPGGIILDFDGLMVDTEYAIYSSWVRVFEKEGHELPLALFNECLGSGYSHWNPGDHLESLTGRTYDWPAINATRQAELEADLKQAGLLPGVNDIIHLARDRGCPLGVASSSSRRWVQGWLEKLHIFPLFDAVVCRTDGYPVKPAPDLFLAAAKLMGVPPDQCLVFEDSKNGVAAAAAAGMKAAAVPNRVTAPAAPFPGALVHAASLCDLLPCS